eukprot:CAMPEP_0204599754 /NCGR_PEP_ID=MMETSP0661-20131031/55019_1 /ASSEMBLY_ACC=CAM_ASM_000606 /TAXON_ID=109239 /ORGANISM="Alexandrium margalefi, Strain AMGDE01CS-322" /LENGTH=422 /DNA_ID=CAMNT_0051610509 /DNA_START=43 /DNA_END=1311 /DNA_ORIENTATION=+
MELAASSIFMKMTWGSAEDLRCNLKGYETALEQINVGTDLNVRDMFEQFKQCGDLLHLAMAVAGKESCSEDILRTLMTYQSLCHRASASANEFVLSCLEALHLHQRAQHLFDKQKPGKAFKKIMSVGRIGRELKEHAGKLVEDVGGMMKQAADALNKSQADKVSTHEDLNKMKQQKQEREEEERTINAELKQLEQLVKAAEEDEVKASNQVNEQERKENALRIVRKVFSFGIAKSPNSDVFFELKAKEKSTQEYSTRMRHLRYQQDTKLSETLGKLDSLNRDADSLEQANLCLQATYQTLGKVKTAFSHLKMFMGIIARKADHASTAADFLADNIRFLERTPMTRDALLADVPVWASLGLANLKAEETMVAASKEADAKMNNLPEVNASKEKVKAWTATLQRTQKRHAEDVQLQDPKRLCIS